MLDFLWVRQSISVLSSSRNSSRNIRRRFAFARHLHARPSKRPDTQDDHRRLEFARINSLLFSIDRFLHSKRRSIPPEDYVLKKLSLPEFHNSSRYLAFEKIISLLLQCRRFKAACYVYDQMIQEGLLPSSILRLKILAIVEVCCSDDKDQMLSSLAKVFLDEKYDEHCLNELVDLLAKLQYSAEVIDSVFDLYVSLRQEDYIPSGKLTSHIIDVLVRGGLLDSAQELLNARTQALSHSDADENEHADASYPYATLLKALSDTKAPIKAAIKVTTRRVAQDKVKPDSATYNALISMGTSRRRSDIALKWYRTFMHHLRVTSMTDDLATVTLRPDAYTFRALFKALRFLPASTKPGLESWLDCRDFALSRTLYRDFVSWHLVETEGQASRRSSVVNPSVLNVALRTFMGARDYPAAFVVVRSFRAFKVWPTLSTYQVVLKSLLAGFRSEMGKRGRSLMMTGICRILTIGKGEERENIYEKLLAFGRKGNWPSQSDGNTQDPKPKKIQTFPSSLRSYLLPTLSMLIGREPVSSLTKFGSIPLERLMRRVIRAAVEHFRLSRFPIKRGDANAVVKHDASPTMEAWQVVAQAKRTMIPSMPPLTEKRKLPAIDQRKYGSGKFLPCFNR